MPPWVGSMRLQRGVGGLRWKRAPSPSLSWHMFPPPAWTLLGPPSHVPTCRSAPAGPCLDPPGALSSSIGPGARLPPSSPIGPRARLSLSSPIGPRARLPLHPSRTLPGPPSSSVGPGERLPLRPSRCPATGPWHQLPEFPICSPGCPSPTQSPLHPDRALHAGGSCVSQQAPRPGPSACSVCPSAWRGHTWSRAGEGAGLVAGKGSARWGPGSPPRSPRGQTSPAGCPVGCQRVAVGCARGLDHRGPCVCTCDSVCVSWKSHTCGPGPEVSERLWPFSTAGAQVLLRPGEGGVGLLGRGFPLHSGNQKAGRCCRCSGGAGMC